MGYGGSLGCPPMKFAAILGGLGLLVGGLAGCGPKAGPFVRRGDGWEYRGLPLNGVRDPSSLVPLDEFFARDARHAYFCTTEREAKEMFLVKRARALIVPGADPASFQVLRSRYARDARLAYYEAGAFEVRDLATFEVLEGNFARDRVTGYYVQRAVPESDGPSFAVIDARYARDRNHVFHGDHAPPPEGGPPRFVCPIVPQADPATFRVLDSGYAVDAQRAFYRGRVLTEELAGFEVLALGYAKSAKEVFFEGSLLPGADAATFALTPAPAEQSDASDRGGNFRRGQRVR